jgi:hypothetical protein
MTGLLRLLPVTRACRDIRLAGLLWSFLIARACSDFDRRVLELFFRGEARLLFRFGAIRFSSFQPLVLYLYTLQL